MEENCCCKKKKHTPRSAEEKKKLEARLHRICGQIDGISIMIQDDRYCGDVLNQIAAAESALQSVGYLILEEHLSSCVADDLRTGKEETIPEAMDLIRKLK